MTNTFNLPLLQAISDWQQGGVSEQKRARGIAVAEAAQCLEARFRKCNLVALRKISLKKQPLWELLAGERLAETISAWTVATDIAKTFKKGVPKPGWQGIIVCCSPSDAQVIVNLSTLFDNAAFKEAIERHKDNIHEFELGMGKYMNSQSEVIIEKDAILPSEIYALGGYSSEPHEIGKIIFGRDVSDEEITWMQSALNASGRDFGAWWIEGEQKDNVLRRVQAKIPELLERKRLCEAKGVGE